MKAAKMYRYYLTQRGPGPGAIPKVWDNLATKVEDFGTKKYVEEINCKAWGYAEYAKPLTAKQIEAYELIEEPKEADCLVCPFTEATQCADCCKDWEDEEDE